MGKTLISVFSSQICQGLATLPVLFPILQFDEETKGHHKDHLCSQLDASDTGMKSYQHSKEWKHEKKKKKSSFLSSALTLKKIHLHESFYWNNQNSNMIKLKHYLLRYENREWKFSVVCKTILTRHFFKDGLIIWLGTTFCDAESMDTQYKTNYSSY